MVYLMKSMLSMKSLPAKNTKSRILQNLKLLGLKIKSKMSQQNLTKFKIRISVIKMYALFFLPELMPLWWFGLEENSENQN